MRGSSAAPCPAAAWAPPAAPDSPVLGLRPPALRTPLPRWDSVATNASNASMMAQVSPPPSTPGSRHSPSHALAAGSGGGSGPVFTRGSSHNA